MKNIQLLLFCFFLFYNAIGENKIDSLKNCLLHAQNEEQKLDLLIKLCYKHKGISYEKAAEYGKMAQILANQLNLKLKEAKSLRYLGIVMDMHCNYDEALQYFNKALIIYKKKNEQEGILKCLNSIALVYSHQDNYDKAIEHYNKISEHWKEHRKYNKTCATSFNNAGSAYWRLGNYDKSLEYNKLALSLQTEINYDIGKARSYNNIAIIHFKKGLYHKALEMYQKALEIFEEKGQNRNVALALNNIGEVYTLQGIYTRALEYQKKALEIRKKLAFKKGQASSYHSLGVTYYEKEDNLAALDCFHKALNIEEKLGLRKYMAESLYHMAKLSNRFGGYEHSVIDYAERSLAIAEEIGALRDVLNACNLLDTIYSQSNNEKKAAMYRQKSEKTKLALQELEKFKADEYYSVKVLKQLKSENEQLLKENEEQKMHIAETKRELSVWWGISVILGVALVISWVFGYRKKLPEINNE